MNIEGFGVGDANKKLTGIESTSGCKIEMSSSKDRSLTFLITGKQADVLKAKRMILVDFQTQANATVHMEKKCSTIQVKGHSECVFSPGTLCYEY